MKNLGLIVSTALQEAPHRLLVNLCVGVLVGPWPDTHQERGRDEAGSMGLGRLLLLGPPSDGSCFAGSIDFMFTCEGTEYEITK